MAHEHKLEIFRGLVKFKSNVTKIWGVLIFLSIVTAIEVCPGDHQARISDRHLFHWYEIAELDFHYPDPGEGLLHYLGLHAHA